MARTTAPCVNTRRWSESTWQSSATVPISNVPVNKEYGVSSASAIGDGRCLSSFARSGTTFPAFSHRAAFAFLEIARRSSGVRTSARAFPPFFAPSLLSSRAASLAFSLTTVDLLTFPSKHNPARASKWSPPLGPPSFGGLPGRSGSLRRRHLLGTSFPALLAPQAPQLDGGGVLALVRVVTFVLGVRGLIDDGRGHRVQVTGLA